jgi:single-strand DNA-binding protein
MNRICIVGRLTADPKSNTVGSGAVVVDFAVAVDRPSKNSETDFFNVKAWGKTGEFCQSYLNKGRLVSVSGRMESRKHTNQEGKTVTYWDLVADQVSGLDKKPEPTGNAFNKPEPKHYHRDNKADDIEDPFAEI